MDTSSVLVMENIRKVYSNGFIANKNVNLSVNKGEIHALVGENGAGKSTLMKVLFGVEKPEEGHIYLRGKEVHIDNPNMAIQMGIGMVYQHFMLVPSLTVAENLVIGMEPRKNRLLFDMDKAVSMVREVAEKYNFDIDPLARIQDLSVGQKQKVEILKVLIRGAEIIILDEPTAGQDFRHYTDIMNFLQEINREGITIIMVTHDMHLMLEYAERSVVFSEGELIADDTGANILTSPDVVEKASLKETSLFDLAVLAGIDRPRAFVQHFINYDREVRR